MLCALLPLYKILALDLEPQLGISFVTATCNAQDLAISGSYAYIAGGEGGLRVIDLTDPANPRPMGANDTVAFSVSVAVSGKFAYVAGTPRRDVSPLEIVGEPRLHVIDISNPANPQWITSARMNEWPNDLAASGNYIYVALSGGLVVFDISDPVNPRRAASVRTSGMGLDVVVSGNLALVADGGAGLQLIDISIPTRPRTVGGYRGRGDARAVAVSGNFAYLAESPCWDERTRIQFEGGLAVIDISDPANPTTTGAVETGGWVNFVGISGSFALVTHWDTGLHVIDVSDPANPRKVSEHGRGAFRGRLAVGNVGDYACLAHLSGLAVLEIHSQETPKVIGGYAPPSDPRDMVLDGDYAYIADGVAGLEIFDLSNREKPQRIGGHFLGLPAERLAISSGKAFVAAGNNLHVIDVANPAKPRSLSFYRSEGRLTDVADAGHYAFLTEKPRWDGTNDVGGGFLVIDLSNPADPKRTGHYKTRGYANNLAISGEYAYVADGRNHALEIEGEGLVVIDMASSKFELLTRPEFPGAYNGAET